MKFLVLLLIVVSCARVMPVSSPQTQLASRIEHASTHNRCTPDVGMTMDCMDDQGLVWTACAWNACGLSGTCRETHQRAVADGSCGEPDWPACKLR